MSKLLIGIFSVVTGLLLGYFLASIFSKQEAGSDEVVGVPSKADRSSMQSLSKGVSGSLSAAERFGDSPSRLALAGHLSWLPSEALNEVMDKWQVLLDELDESNVGDYGYNSFALLVLEEVARVNPEKVADDLIGAGNLHLRSDQLEVITSVWEEMHPGEFAGKIAELPNGTLKMTLDRALTLAFIDADPPQALEKLESGALVRAGDFYQLFSNWVVTDKEATLRAVSRVTDPGRQQEALGGIVEKLGEEDLPLAWQWVGDLAIGDREGLLKTLFTTASNEDAIFLFDAVQDLDDPDLKSRVVLGNVSELSQLNLDKTYDLVTSEFKGDNLYVALANMIPQAVKENPQLALEAIEQLPQGNHRDRLVVELYREWSAVDLEAAMAWSKEMAFPDATGIKHESKEASILWGF